MFNQKHFILPALLGLFCSCEKHEPEPDWRVVTRQFTPVMVSYAVRQDIDPNVSGYYFPAYGYGDQPLYDGYSALPDGADGDAAGAIWTKKFSEPLVFRFEATALYQRAFVKNVKIYTISIVDSEDRIFSRDFAVNFDGYQVPIEADVGEWTLHSAPGPEANVSEGIRLVSAEYPENSVTEITIMVDRRAGTAPQFVLGDLQIRDLEYVEKEYNHPLFETLTNNDTHEVLHSGAFDSAPGDPLLVGDVASYANIGHYTAEFYLQPLGPYDNKRIAWRVLRLALEYYPYYAQRDLNKLEVLETLDEMYERLFQTYTGFIEEAKSLVRDLHDPHFSLGKLPNVRKGLQPVYVRRFGKQVRVVAVLDTTLSDKVGLGDRLIAVDGEPIPNVLESLSETYTGSPSLRRTKAMHGLLRRDLGERAMLTLISDRSGDTTDVTIDYDQSLKLPRGFRKSSHCEFSLIEGDIAYFRVWRFDYEVWLRFLNNAEQLVEAKGLIFDVRGNRGGDDIGCRRVLSTFIDKPVVYAHAYCPVDSTNRESIVVEPNQRYKFKLPVAIVADKRTACASEFFIYSMRTHANAKLFAYSPTAGVASHRVQVNLPSGLAIYFNSWRTYIMPPNVVIEGHGLTPDVWVARNRVADLAPYEDKVLKVAHRFLMGQGTVGFKNVSEHDQKATTASFGTMRYGDQR